MARTIRFSIVHGDITEFEADVAVLKYARSFHGADQAVAIRLNVAGIDISELQLPIGEYTLVDTQGGIGTVKALFIGTEPLGKFRYEQIMRFAAKTLAILAVEASDAQHIAATIHGANYGLDESEALISQFKGFYEVLKTGPIPMGLERITIVEHNKGRVARLRRVLQEYLANASYATPDGDGYVIEATGATVGKSASVPTNRSTAEPQEFGSALEAKQAEVQDIVQSAVKRELTSDQKPHAFIAMPFKKEMDDIFFYGIQQPVHTTGMLCERVDQDAFTGGIMEYVRQRIETAAVVIAELTGGNPNVYLEVGYAWGKGRPTILLARDEKELHFDVRGQKCLTYGTIRELEELLGKEIKAMMMKGIIKP
jgi:hypothetical protein